MAGYPQMDEAFRALADPSRQLLLDRLNTRNGQTLREPCSELDMTRQSVSNHLAVLQRLKCQATWHGAPAVQSVVETDLPPTSTSKEVFENEPLTIHAPPKSSCAGCNDRSLSKRHQASTSTRSATPSSSAYTHDLCA
jgi:hypothetical protein